MTIGLLLLSVSATNAAAESPPNVLLNYDYDSINFTNWSEPENRHWSWWNLGKLMPFPVEIGRGTLPIHEFGERPMNLSGITVAYDGREINLAEYFDHARVNGFLVIKDNDIVYEAYIVFISSATRNLYAFNKRDGELVATISLNGYGFGNPITYRTPSGKQFIVIATSEKDGSDAKLNAFALPD